MNRVYIRDNGRSRAGFVLSAYVEDKYLGTVSEPNDAVDADSAQCRSSLPLTTMRRTTTTVCAGPQPPIYYYTSYSLTLSHLMLVGTSVIISNL